MPVPAEDAGGARDQCGGRGGRALPLLRRVRLSVPEDRAPEAFRVAPRLRHRRARREADRLFLRAGLDQGAGATSSRWRSATRKLKLEEIEGYGETSVRNLFARDPRAARDFARALHLCARHPPCRRDDGARAGARLWHLGGVPRCRAGGRQGRRGDARRDGCARPDRRHGDRRDRGLFQGDAQSRHRRAADQSRCASSKPRSPRAIRWSPARPWCSPARWRR